MKILATTLIFFSLNCLAQNKDTIHGPDSLKIISTRNKIESVKADSKNIYIEMHDGAKDWKDVWLPFIATLFIAYIAYRGVIKQSKASSISGFRVKWIEDLRVSYSRFLIALKNVDEKIRSQRIYTAGQYQKDEDLEEVQFLKTKIKLLLNHNEVTNAEHVAFWKALLQYMKDHRTYYQSGNFTEAGADALDKKRVDMEDLLLVIFKKEWEKAKKFN